MPSGQPIRLQYLFFSFLFFHLKRGLAVILMPPAGRGKHIAAWKQQGISCLMPRFRERHGDASRRRAADAVRLNPRCRRDRVATWRLRASLPPIFFCTCFSASLTRNTHARARMHARHCTSDMKQIRFTPAEGRTPEREAEGGGGGTSCVNIGSGGGGGGGCERE